MDESRPKGLAEYLKFLQTLLVNAIRAGGEIQKIKMRLLKMQLGTTPADFQEQIPSDLVSVANRYRIIKTVGLDALTVFGAGFAGAFLVAIAFHFRIRSAAATIPLALAELLSYTIGFSIVEIYPSNQQTWRRRICAAIAAWLIGMANIPFLGLSVSRWAFSIVWIAMAAAMGWLIGHHWRGQSQIPSSAQDKFGRWNWRRIQVRDAIIVAGSAAAIVILGISYIAYNRQEKPEMAYSNLELGMTMQQVKYAKGNSPSRVEILQGARDQDDLAQGATPVHDFLSQRTLLLLDAAKLPLGKKIDDYPIWVYPSADQHTILRLNFDPDSKTLVGITCIATTYNNTSPFGLMGCDKLRGIQDRWAEDDLIKKMGMPTEEKNDGNIKILRYENLGVQYFLTQGHVFMLSLFSTQYSDE